MFEVTIVYKGGATMMMRARRFDLEYEPGNSRPSRMTFSSDCTPKPLYLAFDEIAGIYKRPVVEDPIWHDGPESVTG